MPRLQVENLTASDIIKRYGWWYRVLNVQIKGDNIGLTIELCSSRPKTKELLVKRGTKFEVRGLDKRVVAEFKSGRICRKPECGIDAELIYRLFFDNTWIEFCPECREITSGDRNQKV